MKGKNRKNAKAENKEFVEISKIGWNKARKIPCGKRKLWKQMREGESIWERKCYKQLREVESGLFIKAWEKIKQKKFYGFLR